MKNKIIFLALFLISKNFTKVCVTQELAGGRFGDQLLSCMHAQYIAFKGNIPFVYTPFIYSDQLALSELEEKVPSGVKIIPITSKNFGSFLNKLKSGVYLGDIKDEAIFKISYFPEDLSEHTPSSGYLFFEVDWKNPDFKKYLRETIAPKMPLKLIDLPDDKISVALHLRLGGNAPDDRSNRYKIPLKLPPLTFFVASLKKLIKFFPKDQKFYVYIFTDEDDTKYYLDYFRKNFSQENITFDCRLIGNSYDKNILEDFFSMAKFNCSIHPLSNYSITAAKIADYLVEIEPLEFSKKGKEIVITKDQITISDRLKELKN